MLMSGPRVGGHCVSLATLAHLCGPDTCWTIALKWPSRQQVKGLSHAEFNFDRLVWFSKQQELTSLAEGPNSPALTNAQIEAHAPSLLVRASVWANQKHILPQAWLAGLIYTHASTQVRATYLLSAHSFTGWWYFFPVAMLVKTPTATLIAIMASILLIVRRIGPRLPRSEVIRVFICAPPASRPPPSTA